MRVPMAGPHNLPDVTEAVTHFTHTMDAVWLLPALALIVIAIACLLLYNKDDSHGPS